MKKIIFIATMFLFVSCDTQEATPESLTVIKDNKTKVENPEITEEIFEESWDEEEIEVVNEVSLDDSPERGVGVEIGRDRDRDIDIGRGPTYSNPSFIDGSSFGNFFQKMHKQGKFKDMLAFTSKESVDKFGAERILDFYENELKFGYDIGKRAISSGTDGDTVILNYLADIMATKTIVRIKVIVENDSTKIILPNNLKDFPS